VEVRESCEFYPYPNLYPLTQKEQIPDVGAAFRPYFSGLLIDNDGFDEKTGIEKIRKGICDAISFGRLYISNPDLAERITNGWELNWKWDLATFYDTKSGSKGYTDYPFYQQPE
jgi:N-ethylmaleimide reductase